MNKQFSMILIAGVVIGGGSLMTMWHYNQKHDVQVEEVLVKEKNVTLKAGDSFPDKTKGKTLPYVFSGFSEKERAIVVTWSTDSGSELDEEERYFTNREGVFFDLPDEKLPKDMNVKATVIKSDENNQEIVLKMEYKLKKNKKIAQSPL